MCLNTHLNVEFVSQTWWYISIIPALGRLWQEDLKFKASLGYIVAQKTKTKINGGREWRDKGE
jgi:hypothetical protein